MGNQLHKPDMEEEEKRKKRQSMRRKKELQEKRQRLQEIKRESEAAQRIQAWWRGTLVRRTLLAAALRAWVIQLWWRRLLWRRRGGLRRGVLQLYAVEEQGAVRLQSWFRMWQCHRGYCQMRGTICLSRDPESCFCFQIQEAPQDPRDPQAAQARRLGAARDLEFRVEILTV